LETGAYPPTAPLWQIFMGSESRGGHLGAIKVMKFPVWHETPPDRKDVAAFRHAVMTAMEP